MFNPRAYENSRPDGIGVLEVVNGMETQEDQPLRFVPLKRTEVRGEVIGPLASLQLIQTYGYKREQCAKVLETVYRFPLPGDAAVTKVRVCFGDVEIRAELKERRRAEADYEEAKRQGRQAALFSRESPDVFTLQVAGIQPDQDVTVETAFVQLARSEGIGWSLRIPLTTAPRYVRSDEITSRHAHGQPLLLLRDPGHRFSLDVTLRGAELVQSATHQLDVTKDGGCMRVRLREGEVIPDRDCVLTWRPMQDRPRSTLHVLLHDEPASAWVYFLALVAPPALVYPGHGVPREVVLLVDHSGSMEGAKWEAADWAAKQFLFGLTDRDTFNVGLFHNTTQWFSRTPRKAGTDGVVQEAVQFLQAHRDSGGTELGVALEQALGLERTPGEYARHVLLVTDAEVSDAGRILRLASEESKRADRRRISVLCIDAVPNSFLATELAERGGGVARFLTSAPEAEDLSTALDEVLADWAEPVLAGLKLGVNRPDVQAGGREVRASEEAGWSSIDLGDLPAGRTLWVAGRAPRGETLDMTFRLTAAMNQVERSKIPIYRNERSKDADLIGEVAACRLDLEGTSEHPALKPLFGARRVLGLEFLIHSGYARDERLHQLERLGYDSQNVLASPSGKPPKVYAENVREEANEVLRGLLVQEALHYGLASAETSFVAVRMEAGKQVEGSVAVANALPAGWSDEFQVGGGGSAVRLMQMTTPLVAYIATPGLVAEELLELSAPVNRLTARTGRMARRSAGFTATPSPAKVDRLMAKPKMVFSGVPQFVSGEAILFDSSLDPDASKLPDEVTINRLSVRFPDGTPPHGRLDPGVSLLIFVDDLSSPKARLRLLDVVRQGGERPLNLLKRPGQVVRLVLVDATGAWASGAPNIEVALSWKA